MPPTDVDCNSDSDASGILPESIFPAQDFVDLESECPICCEPYAEDRIQVPLEICHHVICQICYTWINVPNIDNITVARCPLCREHIGVPLPEILGPLEPEVPVPVEFTCFQGLSSGHRYGSGQDRAMNFAGISFPLDDRHVATIQNKTTVKMSQLGQITTTVMVREVSLKVRSCPAALHDRYVNCTEAQFNRKSREINKILNRKFEKYLFPLHESHTVWLKRDLNFPSALKEARLGTRPHWIRTRIKRSVELIKQPMPGFSSVESVVWTTIIREECGPVAPTREQIVAVPMTDWKCQFKTQVQIQMVLVLSCPGVRRLTQLDDFFRRERFEPLYTKHGLNSRAEYIGAASHHGLRATVLPLSLAILERVVGVPLSR
jgi:hypothetical protein